MQILGLPVAALAEARGPVPRAVAYHRARETADHAAAAGHRALDGMAADLHPRVM